MSADKKITELPVASGINPSDVSVLVDSNVDFQYGFSTLLAFLSANLSTGAVFTFGTAAIPSNSVGNDGDVYVKTDTGQFAQKLSGVWTVVYTIVQGVVGSTIYYGTVAPTTQGINGDTYIQTTGGIFSKKIGGVWVAQFSMATGPVGPAGVAGTNGTNGTNGLSVLHGTTNPSNLLGVDGDFYVNTTNYTFFGPKAAGAWGSGFSLVGPPGTQLSPVKVTITAGITPNPHTVNYNVSDYPGGAKYKLIRTDDNTYDWNTMVQEIIPVSGSASFVITGDNTVVSGTNVFATNLTFWIMS